MGKFDDYKDMFGSLNFDNTKLPDLYDTVNVKMNVDEYFRDPSNENGGNKKIDVGGKTIKCYDSFEVNGVVNNVGSDDEGVYFNIIPHQFNPPIDKEYETVESENNGTVNFSAYKKIAFKRKFRPSTLLRIRKTGSNEQLNGHSSNILGNLIMDRLGTKRKYKEISVDALTRMFTMDKDIREYLFSSKDEVPNFDKPTKKSPQFAIITDKADSYKRTGSVSQRILNALRNDPTVEVYTLEKSYDPKYLTDNGRMKSDMFNNLKYKIDPETRKLHYMFNVKDQQHIKDFTKTGVGKAFNTEGLLLKPNEIDFNAEIPYEFLNYQISPIKYDNLAEKNGVELDYDKFDECSDSKNLWYQTGESPETSPDWPIIEKVYPELAEKLKRGKVNNINMTGVEENEFDLDDILGDLQESVEERQLVESISSEINFISLNETLDLMSRMNLFE